MKYNLEKATTVVQLEPIIERAQDDLLILKNERDDATISGKRAQRSADRKAKLLTDAESKRAKAQADHDSRPAGVEKDKAFAELRTQEARLLKLNLPEEADPVDEIIYSAFEKAQLELRIAGNEDFLTFLDNRKTELGG